MDLCDKLANVKQKLSEKKKVVVAYSGGVDSSLLAKISGDVLGDNALCIILDSVTLSRSELNYATKLAQSMRLNFQIIAMQQLSSDEFAQNRPDRCYLCKRASFAVLKKVAAERGIDCIADGMNLTDYDDYRPGIKASDEMGIWHPFVDACISKEDIRGIARSMELPFWNKPSSACLSSRIPYGERITVENLKMVELAEQFLRDLGFGQLRVRAHDNLARIELLGGDLEKALHHRAEISKKFKLIGFKYISLDLSGFRSGSMNEVFSQMHLSQ